MHALPPERGCVADTEARVAKQEQHCQQSLPVALAVDALQRKSVARRDNCRNLVRSERSDGSSFNFGGRRDFIGLSESHFIRMHK